MTRTRPATLMDSMREGTSFYEKACVSEMGEMRDYIVLWASKLSLRYDFSRERGLREGESCRRGP